MQTQLGSVLESLLFIAGEPMSFGKLGKVTGEKEDAVRAAALELSEEYKTRGGGLRIVIESGKAQMVTAGENSPSVEKLLKIDIEGELSRSALETISIIAYRGPSFARGHRRDPRRQFQLHAPPAFHPAGSSRRPTIPTISAPISTASRSISSGI